ncbi:Uma2 family endonuclease [Thermoleptolyngbya sp. C42_A2020_037]|uniref:Uma2 family endonuclease n=1 Tax=Thermoleptolyngbya sp. C42_A2020_037 TaxID=2747799 RepID=UPI0019F4E228|nr:Uma2 family endonuclease [Thermoleptolyngbya sp. C42_A2020_037]MBF2086148.1 Uma2 family endonuclease [Thermoleptolyngbya sp. C42_A2020_037]
MTSLLPAATPTEIFYPSSDGEPVAETYVHLYAMLVTLEVLRQYLEGQQATVLANQFMYYAQGYPKLRVAPDVMVIFGVAPGGRDNYKIWEEGQVPSVIFEMTSKGTQAQDQVFKRTLYEQLGVREYWLFDPRGEWIDGQLQGYRLHNDTYEPITDGRSDPLKLRLEIDGQLIAFYREDTGEKLLIPGELAQALRTEAQARQDAEARAQELEAEVESLRSRLRELGAEEG